MTDDELLDVNEAAAYLTVHRATLYREVRRGAIATVKVRHSTRVRRSELDRYLVSRERRYAA